MSKPLSVMVAAGGTGGHLFPAFALAEELGRRSVIVDLITDHRGDRYGSGFPAREVYQVTSATLGSKTPLSAAKTVIALARGVRQASKIISAVKPAAVIGFGGYPTFPPLIAAAWQKIPTAIHEQNAVLGRANRMLAKRVSAIATSFDSTKFLEGAEKAKSQFTGNPVRQAVTECASRAYIEPEGDEPFSLLVFGGSQGARYLSDAVPPALAMLPPDLRQRMRVVQQAREEDLVRVEAAYSAAGIVAYVSPFFSNLPELMAASHLVIGRAGASTIAELTVIGRPAILIPLPHSLDNDQLNNALHLAKSGGAWCHVQSELTSAKLAAEIERLMKDGDGLAEAAKAAKSAGRPDAVTRLADFVVGLAQSSSQAVPKY